MRYYAISIAGAPAVFRKRYNNGEGALGAIWGTELATGYDPAAPQIEMDITSYRPNTNTTGSGSGPSPTSSITVRGVSFEQMKAAGQLIGSHIEVRAGMRPGLPLATVQSQYAGKIMSAQITRAWGNWVGTDMSIGLTFSPAGLGEVPGGGGGGSGGGGGGSGGGGGDGGGGGGASGSSYRGPRTMPELRFYEVNRRGLRSIDRQPFARAASGNNPAQTQIGGALLPTAATQNLITTGALGTIGEYGQNAIGSATRYIIDASTGKTFASSFFGGGADALGAPLNLSHNLQPGQWLGSAIQETLQRAFPKAQVEIAISQALKLDHQDAGVYQNMEEYTSAMNKLSHSILGIGNYVGVNFSADGNQIRVWDLTAPLGSAGGVGSALADAPPTGGSLPLPATASSSMAATPMVVSSRSLLRAASRAVPDPAPSTPVQGPGLIAVPGGGISEYDPNVNKIITHINAVDIVGQPTWIDRNKIQITCVMRGDLHPADLISLPRQIWTTIQGNAIRFGTSALPEQKRDLAFAGSYFIDKIHWIGDFRNPDGMSWVAVIDAWTWASTTGRNALNQSLDNSNSYQNPQNAPVSPPAPTDGGP